MRAYVAIVSARFRLLLQYRTAALAGLTTQVFWGLMRVMLFEAFYRSSTAHQPISFEQTITYIWLGQALLGILPWNLDADVRDMIRSGSVAYELTRPLDLYYFWFCRAIALRSAPTLLRAVPMVVIALPFLGMRLPASATAGLACALSILLAVLLSAAITNLLSISLLWTISGDGVWLMVAGITMLFSGSLAPLPLFPAWSQPIVHFLPFRGVMDTPFRIYMGSIGGSGVISAMLHQVAWVIALVVLGRRLLRNGMRRLVVQGG